MKTLPTLALAALLLTSLTPSSAADPVGDVQKWLGCADWIAEQALGTIQLYRDQAAFYAKLAKCKLKYRATTISILSDAELSLVNAAGFVVPNYAEGVVGGSGTQADPFLIGGFEFDGKVLGCPVIRVENTRAHVRITGNWLHDVDCSGFPIEVQNAQNVRIDSNLLTAVDRSISVKYSTTVLVEFNVIEAAYGVLDPTTGLQLAVGQRTPTSGVSFNDVNDGRIQYNNIRRGVGANGPSVTFAGISVNTAEDLLIHANTIEDASSPAISVSGLKGGWNFIQRNNIISSSDAIILHYCYGNDWTYIGQNYIRNVPGHKVFVYACSATVDWNDIG